MATKAGVEGAGLRIQAPLLRMSKADIVREGVRLGVDFAQSWLHGTIRGRCEFIESLPARPERAARFDRRMMAIYMAMVVLLVVSAASTAIM